MRIGIDGRPLGELRTGVGHYTFELARALARFAPADEFDVISDGGFPSALLAELDEQDASATNLRLRHVKANRITRRWWSLGLPLHLRRQKLHLFHGTNYELPLIGATPTVVTIHDLSLLLHPETHEPAAVTRGRRRLPLIVRRARAIITPTESVRREVHELLRVDSRKIVAIPEAARKCFTPMDDAAAKVVRQRLGIGDEFLLTVGTLEPRKNLPRLIEAFENVLRATELRPQLVIVGKKGWLMDHWLAQMQNKEISKHLRFTDYISDDDLRALYSSCCAFIYPSLYEGFGLPPLEAMSCGAAVITSGIPSIKEVVGSAARLVAPEDVKGLTESIVHLLRHPVERERLAALGRDRARDFSWEHTAALTYDVYRQALLR